MRHQTKQSLEAMNFNPDPGQQQARQLKLAEFKAGIAKINPFSLDIEKDFDVMGLLNGFFSERTNELHCGIVSTYEYRSIWETLAYVDGFDATYVFKDVDVVDEDENGFPIWDYFTNFESLDEELHAKLRKMLISFVTAAAGLARYCSSPTYGEWIDQLMMLKFEEHNLKPVFSNGRQWEDFRLKVQQLLQRLWADNEAQKVAVKIQQSTPSRV